MSITKTKEEIVEQINELFEELESLNHEPEMTYQETINQMLINQ